MVQSPSETPTYINMAHVNSTVVFSLATKPDLEHLERTYRNVTYNPRRFRAAIARRPGVALLVFPNGRCVSTGKNAERYFGHISNARVVNRVYSGKIGKRINLLRLQREDRRLFYEPKIFTGARLAYEKATVVIFYSGSYFITGVKDDTLCAPVHAYLQQYGTD